MKTATLTASFQLEIVSIEEDNPFFDYLETYAGKEKCIAEVIDEFVEPPSEVTQALVSYIIHNLSGQLTEGDLPPPVRVFVNSVDKGSVH